MKGDPNAKASKTSTASKSNPKEEGSKPSKPRGLHLLKKAVSDDGSKESKNKFEALALCYANRSAALRRHCQYEDCLRDIARAARFGYPKENMFKLWERKGKCYFGLKRYELAAKCLRQSLNALKESGLSDLAKASKTSELQGLLKEWRNIQELAQMGQMDKPLTPGGSGSPATTPGEPPQLMGATGPLVLIQDPNKPQRKVSEPVISSIPEPARPERRSVRRKPLTPGGLPVNGEDPRDSGELRKTESRISISQISMGGRSDLDMVPDLSYGVNSRMPSASVGIDLRFAPERGRFFVAKQDLHPGK